MATQTINLTDFNKLSQSGGSGGITWGFSTSGGYAMANTTTSGVSSFVMPAVKGSNYGFSIPTGATINGITVTLEIRNLNFNGDTTFISNINLPSATAKSFDIPVSGSTTYVSYTRGSSSDKWGRTWTASDINASTFGPTVTNTASQTKRDTVMRRWEITVDYTPTVDLVIAGASHGLSSEEATALAVIDPWHINGGWGSSMFGGGWGMGLLDGAEYMGLDARNASHGHVATSPLMTQAHLLAIANALHAHTADNVAILQAHALAIDNALHALTSESMTLEQLHNLIVASTNHLLTSDSFPISQQTVLYAQDAIHALTTSKLILLNLTELGIDSGGYLPGYGVGGDYGTGNIDSGFYIPDYVAKDE